MPQQIHTSCTGFLGRSLPGKTSDFATVARKALRRPQRSLAMAGMLAALAAGMAAPATVMAGVPSRAQALAANCAPCHGTDGRSISKETPVLAGISSTAFMARFQEFRAATRDASVMTRHAKGYTDEEIALLADYFSSIAR